MAAFFTELMRRYLPDPFVFAIGLTLLTMVLAITVQGQSSAKTLTDWGDGFWNLLAFTTQMAVILVMGYVLATSPLVDRFLNFVVRHVDRPKAAIVVATIVGAAGSYLNWGFGLVIGGIVARKLALRVQGVHYPLIISAAYSGFTLYGLGISATIPVLISTPGHPMQNTMGLVPLTDTIFSIPMILTSAAVLITLPFLNASMHPKNKKDVIEVSESAVPSTLETTVVARENVETTLASRINNNPWLNRIIGVLAMAYLANHFYRGGALDLNKVNFLILFLGVILLKTPAAYIAKVNEGIKTISGVILQYPFYAGIMAIMAGSGLVDRLSHFFLSISTAHTLPFWGLVSSFVINFFAPSAGGHWAIQGPFMMEAAHQLNTPYAQTAQAVMLGNAWNDMVQPFWILPTLALSKLKLKDIMGYAVVVMLWVGALYMCAVLAWGYFGQ
jgi:short-chain fatty acids transporter